MTEQALQAPVRKPRPTGARRGRRKPVPQIKTARDRTLLDLLLYPKSRKLILYWTPFVLLVAPLAAWHVAAWWQPFAGLALGIGVYSLIEYASHRWLYHHEPETRWVRLVTGDVARQHLNHHKEPGKYSGAINGNQLPIVVFATLVTVLALAVPLPQGITLVAIVAGAVNYVAQELIHFGTHFLPMRHPVLAAVKRHHMLHHYQADDTNYGLFWTFWDRPFGTDFHRRHRARKAAGDLTPPPPR